MKKYKSSIIEQYGMILNILDKYKNSDVRCISVTSNRNMEDKSVIAKNIAAILAKSNEDTLLIDCNLNTLQEAKSVKSSNSTGGLVNMLEAASDSEINYNDLKKYIEKSEVKGLFTLTLGTDNLSKHFSIFKTEYLKIVIDKLKTSFSYIILDIPSFENMNYVYIISSASDGCIFILKEGINDITEGEKIKEKLDKINCKVLGCILNKEKVPTEIISNFIGD